MHSIDNLFKLNELKINKQNTNFETMSIVSKFLRMNFDYETTTEYFQEVNSNAVLDYRMLADGKKRYFTI